MFEIKGIVNKKEQAITYSNESGAGAISGDEMICFIVEDAMKSKIPVGPVGQYMDRDINNPLAVLFVILECFDKVTAYSGDLPEADEVPEGTIA
jgi:diphthamide biosynthesis methyltransferase